MGKRRCCQLAILGESFAPNRALRRQDEHAAELEGRIFLEIGPGQITRARWHGCIREIRRPRDRFIDAPPAKPHRTTNIC
ncbi:MAG: hypothetical protein R3C26_19785 [Calditrichia bacterium]